MARELVKTISQGKRNLLINSNFAFAQRGNQLATTGGGLYLLDRWQAWTSSAGSVSGGEQRQSSLPAGFPGVFNQTGSGQGNCHRLFATVNDFTQGSSFLRRQKVESIRLKDGERRIETVSCGVWVYANNMQSATIQIFNADSKDNFSTITLLDSNTELISDNTWQYIEVTDVSIPNDNGLEIRVSVGGPIANVFTDTYIAEVMCNEGPTVESFRLMGETLEEEIAHARRYYQSTYDWNVPVGSITGNGALNSLTNSSGHAHVRWDFKVTMRAEPIITGYSRITGNVGQWGNGTAINSIGNIGQSSAFVTGVSQGADNIGASSIHLSADAEL